MSALVECFTPNSFRTSRLPLLKLPDDILVALREGKIEYTKAQAIARLKDQQGRERLLGEAIAQQLSLTQIKRRIRDLTTELLIEDMPSLKKRWLKINATLKRKGLWQKLDTQQEFEHLISKLENLLRSNS